MYFRFVHETVLQWLFLGTAKFGATPEEIEAAAKSAQMHDRIMSFPEGCGHVLDLWHTC